MCVYARAHTHYTDGVLCCEPRGRDETLGGPDESRLVAPESLLSERVHL